MHLLQIFSLCDPILIVFILFGMSLLFQSFLIWDGRFRFYRCCYTSPAARWRRGFTNYDPCYNTNFTTRVDVDSIPLDQNNPDRFYTAAITTRPRPVWSTHDEHL